MPSTVTRVPFLRIVASAIILLCIAGRVARAQAVDSATGAATLDSMLRAHSRAMSLEDGRLAGPGADLIRGEFLGVQFVALGERHDVADIGVFASALMRELAATKRLSAVAVENGSIAIGEVQREARTGRAQLEAFVRRYPVALEFAGDADIDFYASVIRELGTHDVLWGIDQEFGATHVLDLIGSSIRDPSMRRSLDSLRARVRYAESSRFTPTFHWLGLASDPNELAELATRARHSGDTHASDLLTALQQSAHVYDLYRRATKGALTGLQSNVDREDLIKAAFMKHYRAMQAAGVATPVVMLKMGQGHLGRGQGPFGPFTIGNMISEFAMTNGMRSLHIAILAHNPRVDSLPSLWSWPAMAPVAKVVPEERWSVLDLRPLRPYARAGRLGPLGADLRRIIDSYDLLVTVGGAHNTTFRYVGGK
jgi:hypothetical protein